LFIGGAIACAVVMTIDKVQRDREHSAGETAPNPEAGLFCRLDVPAFDVCQSSLIAGCAGGLALSVGMLGFGWTATPSVHWMVSAVFLTSVYFGMYSIFQAVW
jgi:hypothetical protein